MSKNQPGPSSSRSASSENAFPGQRLGLAQSGPTSMAGFGQRLGAILVDWFIATGLTWFIVGSIESEVQPIVLLIFGLMHWVGIAVLSATVGKAIFRIQVVQVGGAKVGFVKALIRTVLLLPVVPVVIIDEDGRGLHDRGAGTVQIRM